VENLVLKRNSLAFVCIVREKKKKREKEGGRKGEREEI